MERETEAALSQMLLAAEDMQTFGMGAVLIRPDLSAMVVPPEILRGQPEPTSAQERLARMVEGGRKLL
ncbi:hypothetical protein J5N58_01300 [Rhizobium cremeum]|uniref:hypothetical protein n=1 Tax=Rhizobium cremeum TaxID=2813827 RepID=UPI001FD0F111|nr:hypothetical protein [Rhizobium cremeum]MCJ7993233.1 hypothetical protein [Rhizobium cremeum]MCJ7998298.1 hypothetical protein [Rhizobium cremeum]